MMSLLLAMAMLCTLVPTAFAARADYEDIGMGPDGWTLYKDYVIDLKDYVDKCSIALHWHPGRTNPETQAASSQRTYWINADLVITPVQQVQLNLIREDVVVQQQMNVEQKLVIILIKSVVLG